MAEQSPRLDPNVVAEYLDNTLDAEGVTEFEKVCLESDIALAEVASCHQILTLVLGEPAEIDPTTRQRMYQVPEPRVSLAPPVVPTAEAGFVTTSVVLPPTLDLGPGDEDREERKPRPKPTVPEYLREPRKSRRWVPAVAGLVVAVSVIVVVLNTIGLLESGTPLGDMLVRWGLIEAPRDLAARPEGKATPGADDAQAKRESPPAKETAAESPKQSAKPLPVEAAPEKAADKAAGKAIPPPATKEPVKTPAKPSPAGAANEPVKTPAAATPVKPEAPVKPETPAKASPAAPAPEPIKMPAAETALKPEPIVPVPSAVKPEPVPGAPHAEPDKTAGLKPPAAAGETAKVPPKPMAPLPPDLTGTAPAEPDKSAEPKAPGGPLPPEALARLMSADQLLLKDEPASGGWVRVAANQMLMPRRLLALPTYRAHVTLTVGVTLEVLGGTELELLASSPAEMPGIAIRYGRVVLMPLAKAGSRLRVIFGNRGGVITFPDAESVAALEVRRIHPPGANPEAGPPHIVADLYASAGGVTWEELGDTKGVKTLRLAAPQWVSFNGTLTSAPATSKDLPPWITAERIGMLDHRASVTLAKELPTDRLARIGLLELNASRPQKEVKWLARQMPGGGGPISRPGFGIERSGPPAGVARVRRPVARGGGPRRRVGFGGSPGPGKTISPTSRPVVPDAMGLQRQGLARRCRQDAGRGLGRRDAGRSGAKFSDPPRPDRAGAVLSARADGGQASAADDALAAAAEGGRNSLKDARGEGRRRRRGKDRSGSPRAGEIEDNGTMATGTDAGWPRLLVNRGAGGTRGIFAK